MGSRIDLPYRLEVSSLHRSIHGLLRRKVLAENGGALQRPNGLSPWSMTSPRLLLNTHLQTLSRLLFSGLGAPPTPGSVSPSLKGNRPQ